MENNSNGDTRTETRKFRSICLRQYVADVRRRDWKKCFPFNLSGDSPESNYQAQRLFASLLEDNDVLVNTLQNTEAPNSLTFSDGGNPEVQAVPSETHTGVIIANDATTAINDKPLGGTPEVQAAPSETPEVQAAPSETHTGVIIANDATTSINDRHLESAFSKETYADGLIENIIHGDTLAAESENPEDAGVEDDTMNYIDVGASKSSSSKLNDDVQCQNENNISEDTIAAGNDNMVADDDGAYTISEEERNLAGEKPQKFRLLSDILKQLAGPCDAVSARCGDNEISSETEDDSDDFTLDTIVRKKKGVRVTSKSGVVTKKKKRSRNVRERSFDRAKRMKPVPADSCPKKPELRSKRQLKKTRTDVDFLVKKKHKKSSSEIIVHEGTSRSQKVAASSLGGIADNRLGAQKDSLLSCGDKRNRETSQDDHGRDVLELLDGSQRPNTEVNSSRLTYGVKSTELVQPTIAILDNIETASGCVQKRIREDSPPIDNESMAALQLLRLFNSGLTTHTSSKTATEDPALSLSIVGQLNEESNVINGAGLLQAEQTESGTSVCAMNMNPSEFSIPNAKKYMRRVKDIQK